MCGLAGILHLDGSPVGGEVLRQMTKALAHRGPDGEGFLVDGPCGLGHRRLSIIDLSDAGSQPMAGEDGQVVVIHNGEIYNFQQLRLELQGLGHRFHSRTDTEVIVHAYEEWGDACVERFNGMFAFAIWDRRRRRLFVARDRYGVKPLYWWCDGRILLFASEVKALLRHPKVRRDVNVGALNEYFTFQNVFTERTLFEGVRLLAPGTRMVVEQGERAPRTERYWDYVFTGDGTTDDAAELVERVATTFREAVTRQLISDVPVGGYLSGGMDSSSLVAVAAEHVPRLSTFTAGFDMSSASGLEISFDERAEAESLANLLKTEHYEVVLHAGDMEWVLPELIWHLEDLRVGQCYPNYYVARLASKFVKVVLSGAGGDELFGGYPWRYYRGEAGATGPEAFYDAYYRFWQRLVPDEDKSRLFLPETQRALGDESAFDAFRSVFDGWSGGTATAENRVEASLYFELKTFLHGLLVVEDKISMAHSLETRVPFLDNDLVDLALRIPSRHKLRQGAPGPRPDENTVGKRLLYDQQTSEGKAILRQAMATVIPGQVASRPKQGFSAPDASWFRGESVDYINRLLRDRKAAIYDFIDPAYVAGILDEHTSGRTNHRLLIWSLLSFEWWCRGFLRGEAGHSA